MVDPAPSSGEDHCSQRKQWPNGNAAGRRLFNRRFEPRSDKDGGGTANNSRPTGVRTANLKLHSWLTIQLGFDVTATCLPTAWSFLSENF